MSITYTIAATAVFQKESRLELLNKELSMENNEVSEEKETKEKFKEKSNNDIEL